MRAAFSAPSPLPSFPSPASRHVKPAAHRWGRRRAAAACRQTGWQYAAQVDYTTRTTPGKTAPAPATRCIRKYTARKIREKSATVDCKLFHNCIVANYCTFSAPSSSVQCALYLKYCYHPTTIQFCKLFSQYFWYNGTIFFTVFPGFSERYPEYAEPGRAETRQERTSHRR